MHVVNMASPIGVVLRKIQDHETVPSVRQVSVSDKPVREQTFRRQVKRQTNGTKTLSSLPLRQLLVLGVVEIKSI